MMFADMVISDAIWLALIGVLTIAVKEYFDRQRAKDAAAAAASAAVVVANVAKQAKDDAAAAQSSASKAATATKQVETALATATEETHGKLDTIHALVNSDMAKQLQVSAIALRRVADLTGHADDATAAELAENNYREHQAKQATADAGDAKRDAARA